MDSLTPIVPFPLPPITENTSSAQFEANVIIFQNIGTSTVLLADCWTILPKASWTFNSSDPNDVRPLRWNPKIFFDQTSGTTNRLEVMLIDRLTNC